MLLVGARDWVRAVGGYDGLDELVESDAIERLEVAEQFTERGEVRDELFGLGSDLVPLRI